MIGNIAGIMGNYEARLVANTEIDGGIVDTCRVTDSHRQYETGISHPAYHDGLWVIVEGYDTKEQAALGHARWVAALAAKPARLTDVSECGIARLADALGVDIRGVYDRKEG